jgi:hypothetical protein
MFAWPDLDLTDEEREYVRYYATQGKPGALRRTYKVLLANVAIAAAAIPVALVQNFQTARRVRVFGLTFAGDVSRWFLDISTASGESLTPPNPLAAQVGNPRGCLVSTLSIGTPWNALAVGGGFPGAAVVGHDQWQSLPHLVEPNVILTPNETLIFSGTPIVVVEGDSLVLEVGIHVWEFPDMGGQ